MSSVRGGMKLEDVPPPPPPPSPPLPPPPLPLPPLPSPPLTLPSPPPLPPHTLLTLGWKAMAVTKSTCWKQHKHSLREMCHNLCEEEEHTITLFISINATLRGSSPGDESPETFYVKVKKCKLVCVDYHFIKHFSLATQNPACVFPLSAGD